ncbi:DUF4350 domain-containing protein, partial [Streptomyces sp. SID5785]|uniref:DUF4350 domain-containing protein n=1 Tax=Streptomyces sp. SID5785 TaxID=2690309 RepID=UPI001360E746|nr:DUF4350 domain-containing protein [Streptomyces sp. SID5785]
MTPPTPDPGPTDPPTGPATGPASGAPGTPAEPATSDPAAPPATPANTPGTPTSSATGTPGTPTSAPPSTGTGTETATLTTAAPPPAEPPQDTGNGAAATSVTPTVRQVWTRTRGIALALVLLLVAGIAIAAVRSGERHGTLDPRSADPYGSRAVAELLADRGVDTRVVTTTDQARAAVGPDTTLLVAVPDLLTPHQQNRLRAALSGPGADGRTVLIAPGPAAVSRLAPGVTADPDPVPDMTLDPDCDLPEARRAGPADTGGLRYDTAPADADSCYPSNGSPTLLRLPAHDTDTDTGTGTGTGTG